MTGRPAAGEGVLLEAGDVDGVFPFVSVTKPVVAWAALVTVDRGLLDLEAPAGSSAPNGVTIENLLSYPSEIAADPDKCLAAPGTRHIYSNRGIGILGEQLEETTGTPLEAWVETIMFESLGTANVFISGSSVHSGGGSARDLSLFARKLAVPKLVSPALARRARAPVLPGPDGVLPRYRRQAPDPFGLGIEVRGARSPRWTGTGNSEQAFRYFGQSGPFIWVDPITERQTVSLEARPFRAVYRRTWSELGDQILALWRLWTKGLRCPPTRGAVTLGLN